MIDELWVGLMYMDNFHFFYIKEESTSLSSENVGMTMFYIFCIMSIFNLLILFLILLKAIYNRFGTQIEHCRYCTVSNPVICSNCKEE